MWEAICTIWLASLEKSNSGLSTSVTSTSVLDYCLPLVLSEDLDSATEAGGGLTKRDARAWLEAEPDFAKRIVTALDNKREGNRTLREKTKYNRVPLLL
jgi:hypothetical protein